MGGPEETRPVANMSPWVSAYDSIRYDDLREVTEAVMTGDCHGGRRGHEVYSVRLKVALEIEEAEVEGEWPLFPMVRSSKVAST